MFSLIFYFLDYVNHNSYIYAFSQNIRSYSRAHGPDDVIARSSYAITRKRIADFQN